MAVEKIKRRDIARTVLHIAETKLTEEQQIALAEYQTWTGQQSNILIEFPLKDEERRSKWAQNLEGYPSSTDPVFDTHVPRDKIVRATRNPLSRYEREELKSKVLDQLATGLVDYFETSFIRRNS